MVVGFRKVLGLHFPLINRRAGLSEPQEPATELIEPQGGCTGEVIPPQSQTIICTLHTHAHTVRAWRVCSLVDLGSCINTFAA